MNTTTIAATLLRRANVHAILGENMVHHDDTDGEYRPFGVVRMDDEPAKPAKPKKPQHALPPKKKPETTTATVPAKPAATQVA